MACVSIETLQKKCSIFGTAGGTTKLWMIAFKDLAILFGTDKTYTLDEDGNIDMIGLKSGKQFVEVAILPNSVGLDSDATIDSTKSLFYLTQTLKLTLSDLIPENRTFVENIGTQPIAVIVKTRTNQYIAAGLNGNLYLKSLKETTGTSASDLIGYDMTFEGTDDKLFRHVLNEIVDPYEFFSYLLEVQPGNNGMSETETVISFENP